MIKAVIIAIIFAIIAIMVSCATDSVICKTLPEGETSLICAASEELGTTPENVGKWLKISTFVVVESGVAKDEILELIDNADNTLLMHMKLARGITPNMVLGWLNSYYAVLSPQAMAALQILDPFEGIDFESLGIKPFLSDFDIGLLRKHLAEQKALVESL